MNMPFSTLVDLLSTRAKTYPNKTAYTFLRDGEMLESSMTYAVLDQRARTLASHLIQGQDVRVGDRVLLWYPPGLEYIAAFFGCLYAGAIPVPAYPPNTRNISRLLNISEDAGAKLALSTAEITTNLQESQTSVLSPQNTMRIVPTDTIP